MNRRTLRRAISGSGTGVHSGAKCSAEVRRAAFGDGLCVEANGVCVPIGVHLVVPRAGATVLQIGEGTVSTVEHLLAALVAAGITDAIIAVEGGEVPILDGSAYIWWTSLGAVGVVDGPPIDPLFVEAPIEVEHAGGIARWLPASGCTVAVDVDYGVFAGKASLGVPGPEFASIAAARTFAMGRDLDQLLATGRGRGATLEDTVIWDEGGPRNPLRMVDEPVFHKLIDAIGDLALVGRPVSGRLDVIRGSHALHHEAVRRLLAAA